MHKNIFSPIERYQNGKYVYFLFVLKYNPISQRNDLRRALLDALHRGHVDFVELLIEYGASLEKLTITDIEQLYEIVD
jgi:hypothetical protein